MCDLYKRIYGLCQAKGISIGRMCANLRISRGNLTELKMGRIKTLKTDNLTKIADYFNVTVDFLLCAEESTPSDFGKRAESQTIQLSTGEQTLVRKYRCLDERGKSAVQNVLNHEYDALHRASGTEEELCSHSEAARNGSFTEYELTTAQLAEKEAKMDARKDVPEGL